MPVRRKTTAASYQLKITLLGTKPPVWRRLLVPAGLTLADLHRVVQVAMGWGSVFGDYHLHEFKIDGAAFGNPANSDEGDITDERKVKLSQVAGEGSRFGYWYDFGDDWHHRIVVERILDQDPAAPAALSCLAGRRACPPEDCGGVWGYAELLAVLDDPGHPDHGQMAGWAGEIDPEAFDREAVNARLTEMFPVTERRRPVVAGRP